MSIGFAEEINYQINVNPQTVEIFTNESLKLDVTVTTTPTGYDRFFNNIQFESSNEEIAIVTSDGFITGLTKGETTVKITLLEEEKIVNVTVKSNEDLAWIWTFILLIILILLVLFIVVNF